MAMRVEGSRLRKQRDWRRTTVFVLAGFLAGILFWVLVLWAALQTE